MTATTDLRPYKATFLLDTRGYTEPVDTLVTKLRDTITAVQGEVTSVEPNAQRDFARPPDRGYTAGTYVTILFKGPASAPPALREKLRLDQHVNRVLVQSV